jgi:hypothetical protein
MFFCVCTSCGRSQQYDGPEDNRCPACWGQTILYCPNCNTYLKEKPGKTCPYCKAPFVKPAAAPARPGSPAKTGA